MARFPFVGAGLLRAFGLAFVFGCGGIASIRAAMRFASSRLSDFEGLTVALTSRQTETMNLYASIMEEAKIRLMAIEHALNGRTALQATFVREFSFLQLRMLCELIALGCLTAHGDIKKNDIGLKKEYAADKIMGQLEELHPDFYPKPVLQTQKPYGFELSPVPSGFLTKPELLSLYGRSGGVLHRGSIKKLLSPKMPLQTNFPDIVEWARKINVLLRLHVHFLLDGHTTFICVLRNANDDGRAQVAIATSSDPPPADETSPPA